MIGNLKMVEKNSLKILLTGGTGFIGSHLVEALLGADYELVVLKRSFDDTTRIDPFLNRIKTYDTDKQDFDTIFSQEQIDIVINLVTNFGRGKANLPSDIAETNIVYGLKLIEAATTNGVKCFFNVDSALKPEINLYAFTKRAFREIIKKSFSEKIKIMNLRLEQVYGEHDDLFKFIPMAVDKLKRNEDLDMTFGEQQLDLLYIDDCVSAFLFLVDKFQDYPEQFTSFEIGTGKTIKLKDFIEQIKQELGSTSKINYGAVDYRADEQMLSKADLNTMKGWRPTYDFSDGLKRLVK
jgi:nucleoside-diphosphate-sugar epimerase